MAFHVNPKTGEPSACKATKTCPFGSADEHFASRDEARAAYEASQNTFTVNPYADLSTDELATIEAEMLSTYRAEHRELSSEEYDRHYEYIRRVRKENPSTHKQFTKSIKGKATYASDRLSLHDAIVDDISAKYQAVKAEGRAIVIGGITGAGKTTTLNTSKDFEISEYASVNPDEVKVEMVKRGMVPEIPGLLPLETDELIKYEAQLITTKLYERMSSEKRNIVIDRTMANFNQVSKSVNDLKTKGYTNFVGIFVDVDPDEAYERIRARHHEGVNKYLTTGEGYGERPVPGSAIAATRTDDPSYRSKNAKVFIDLVKAEVFTSEPLVFDSSKRSTRIDFENFANL